MKRLKIERVMDRFSLNTKDSVESYYATMLDIYKTDGGDVNEYILSDLNSLKNYLEVYKDNLKILLAVHRANRSMNDNAIIRRSDEIQLTERTVAGIEMEIAFSENDVIGWVKNFCSNYFYCTYLWQITYQLQRQRMERLLGKVW